VHHTPVADAPLQRESRLHGAHPAALRGAGDTRVHGTLEPEGAEGCRPNKRRHQGEQRGAREPHGNGAHHGQLLADRRLKPRSFTQRSRPRTEP